MRKVFWVFKKKELCTEVKGQNARVKNLGLVSSGQKLFLQVKGVFFVELLTIVADPECFIPDPDPALNFPSS